MSDLIRFLEDLDPKLWPWADLLILLGLVGGIVFAVWIVSTSLADIFKTLFLQPNRRLGIHAKREPVRPTTTIAAIVIVGSIAAIAWRVAS